MRFVPLLFLLSACASEPDYPSHYSAGAAAGGYDDPLYTTGTTPETLALSAAPCTPYYTPAYPPPLGLIPCQAPLLSTMPGYAYPFYPGYGYPFYPGYGYPFYPGYAAPFFPAFGYGFYATRRIGPFHRGGHVGPSFRHTPGHVGRRGKR